MLGFPIALLSLILLVAGALPPGVALAGVPGTSNFANQMEDVPRGEVVRTIICRSDPGQSYSAYLPSAYTPQETWPIIYAFDPGARGQIPVDRFAAAAEKYGYIVVGSHNSRNGPWTVSFSAMKAMWTDTHERFRI
ncbi:MAG: hypothetical protein JSW54_09335, partial [Fidelibacterota bacterium]